MGSQPKKKTANKLRMKNRPLPKYMLRYLLDRGISQREAEKRGIYYLPQSDAEKQFGTGVPMTIVPFHKPDGSPLINKTNPFMRARTFTERATGFMKNAQGIGKFLQPYNTKNHLYLDPVLDGVKVCKDNTISIVITEGEFKAICANIHGLICIAITGVSSWKTKIDGGSVPLPELDWFEWKGRRVELAFDADAQNNPQVMDALKTLAAELIRRGAEVLQVHIPEINEDEKTGLDDFLVAEGIDAYYKLHREDAVNPAIVEMNEKHAVIMNGGKVLIMTVGVDPNFSERITVKFSTPADMRTLYANRKIKVGDKCITYFDYWITNPARREYKGIVFSPGEERPGYYNLWNGFSVEPKKGDCRLYKKHMLENISQGDKKVYNYLMAWMADAVQNLTNRTGVALVLRGLQGTGKGVFVNIFGRLFGQHYKQVSDPRHLVGNFNAHLKDTLILFADEAFFAGDKAAEGVLKRMVTEPTLSIEAKFQDVIEVKNNMRLLVASNHDWVVPAGLEERRFCIIDVGEKNMQDSAYFGAIHRQMDNDGLEALLYELLHYDLSGVDLRDFPKTDALLEQKIHSMDTEQKFWYQILHDGVLPYQNDWGDGNITAKKLFSKYISFAQDIGTLHRLSDAAFGKKIKKLCPTVHKHRPTNKATKRREWIYKFPSCPRCREDFERILGSEISWGDNDE